ncbi:MAG: Gfo/Idh/MocA family oxidoreductase [Candidatus Omnitrophica bacterium]|nr:Gfo/Idh/MocA family oxidoreductase [Candidatus Omnitrophota bacterium]
MSKPLGLKTSAGFAPLSRRRFLRYSACAVGVGAVSGLARAQSRIAGQKLNLGFIATGGQGAANLKELARENIVALCDVNAKNLAAAAQQFPGAKVYQDFRKLLEQKDIEAVVISTADHTHAVVTLLAMRLGKHVYSEQPLTHSIHENGVVVQAARDHKVATQMGVSAHAADGYRDLVEWVEAGVIGPVHEVHAWTDRPLWPQGLERPPDTPALPEYLNWDLWLGPAPVRPYNPAYEPVKWRGWWDFGSGALGDMGCHILDAPFWVLNLRNPSAIEAESSGVNPETAPKWSIIRYSFPARPPHPPLKLTWYDGGRQPEPDLLELPAGQKMPVNCALLVGEKGKILIPVGAAPRLVPESAMKDFKTPPQTQPRSIGHYREWLEACKGGKPAGCNFDYAGPLTDLVLLGNVALRTGKRIEWDAQNAKITNVPEAAPFLCPPYRQGWTL